MSELPTWYPGGDHSKVAPMPLMRVQALVNTRDLEEGTDLLADPASARVWLVDAGLLRANTALSDSDLALAREVREAFRALLELAAGEHGAERLEPLRALAASHRARLRVGDDATIGLANAREEDLSDALFGLLLIIHQAQHDDSFSRLKVCADEECQWAFYDRSRNRQGSWCNMAACGNRHKNRQLRARKALSRSVG